MSNHSIDCRGSSLTGLPVETQADNFPKFSFDPFFAFKIESFHKEIMSKKQRNPGAKNLKFGK